jgi:5-bromo-4-chloroindolyl phosphate hydrolysis protein
MNTEAFKAAFLPVLVQVLTGLSKYIVVPVTVILGVADAKANNLIASAIELAAGLIVGLAAQWLSKKHILTQADLAAGNRIQEQAINAAKYPSVPPQDSNRIQT